MPVVDLPAVTLPDDGPLRRHVRPKGRQTAHYLDRFDRQTLFYDLVHDQSGNALVLTAPRFLNLWPLLREGLSIDGQRPRIGRKTWLRCEQLRLPRGDVSLTLPGGDPVALAPRADGSDAFAGRRALVAVNKDNRLEWLHDWARAHARLHGADAVLLFDNGSGSYTPQAALEALTSAPGIATATVVSAPFPYGPSDKGGRFDVSPRFFQTAMLAIARADFLRHAAGVLSVDIDEVVRTRSGRSIFEMAQGARLGLVAFRGIDVLPARDTGAAQAYRDHVCRLPGTGNTKWCLDPAGFMNRFGWAVHRFGGAFFPLTIRTDAEYLHFRTLTTNWKNNRFGGSHSHAVDPDIRDFVTTHF